MPGFWVLLIGLLLMIIASLIAGGYCEMNGWAWTFYVLGIILVIVGVALLLWSWNKGDKKAVTENCVQPQHLHLNTQHSPLTFTQDVSPRFTYSQHHYTPHSPHSIPVISETVKSVPVIITRPISVPSTFQSVSPAVTPTLISSNIPQAQRGFATTAVDLSALSPV